MLKKDLPPREAFDEELARELVGKLIPLASRMRTTKATSSVVHRFSVAQFLLTDYDASAFETRAKQVGSSRTRGGSHQTRQDSIGIAPPAKWFIIGAISPVGR
jgi:hypothetical protein